MRRRQALNVYSFCTYLGTLFSQVLDKIKSDFQHSNESNDIIFKRMNNKLRLLSLEIKSVLIKDSESGVLIYHHGLVNLEEDQVAKDYGSNFSPIELQAFTKILVKLIEVNFMSSADIIKECKPDNWTSSMMDSLLMKFKTEGWLERNTSNYWFSMINS